MSSQISFKDNKNRVKK